MRLRRFVSFSPLTLVAAAVVVALALSVGATPAEASEIEVSVAIDAAQASESAMPGASGSGKGTVTYNNVTNLLSWNITFSGTQGTFLSAHFHAAEKGVGGPIEVTIPGTGSPLIGSATITDLQEADLAADLFYINIHTDHSPGGEIRGQFRVPAVGGVAEIVDVDAAPLAAAGSSGTGAGTVAAITVLIAVAVLVLGGGAWYVGRRALR